MSTPPTSWRSVADAYARAFAPLCAGTVDVLLDALLTDAPGTRLLDVGSGTGTLAARATARGCTVTAVEPDPDMRALAAGSTGIAPVDGGLPALPFEDGAFDAVAANFVVNHVADPRVAVAELLRVTAPGGWVGLSVWPSVPTAQSRLWAAVLEDAAVAAPAGPSLPEHLDFPRTPDGLGSLLELAGAVDVLGWQHAWDHRTDPDDLWSGQVGGVGRFGGIVAAQDPQTQARLKQAYDALVTPLLEDGLLVLPSAAVLAVARRPG